MGSGEQPRPRRDQSSRSSLRAVRSPFEPGVTTPCRRDRSHDSHLSARYRCRTERSPETGTSPTISIRWRRRPTGCARKMVLGIGGARILEALSWPAAGLLSHERGPRGPADDRLVGAGAGGEKLGAGNAGRMWKRCAGTVSSPPTRRFPPGMIASLWSRAIAF